MVKEKLFRNVVSNLVIILILVSLIFIGFSNDVISVFSHNGNSAIYRGNSNEKNVSLMINVYWGEEYIDEFISILNKYNSKATFFVGGCYVAKNEKILHSILNSGNEIGNHGYYHKDCTTLSDDRIREEITITHSLVKQITGYEMTLFAPPSGAVNENTCLIAGELNYKTIMWSKDTIDWRDKDSNLIYNRAIKNPQNGDLILMHPSKETLMAFEKIVSFYVDLGFNVTTVSKNIQNL